MDGLHQGAQRKTHVEQTGGQQASVQTAHEPHEGTAQHVARPDDKMQMLGGIPAGSALHTPRTHCARARLQCPALQCPALKGVCVGATALHTAFAAPAGAPMVGNGWRPWAGRPQTHETS